MRRAGTGEAGGLAATPRTEGYPRPDPGQDRTAPGTTWPALRRRRHPAPRRLPAPVEATVRRRRRCPGRDGAGHAGSAAALVRDRPSGLARGSRSMPRRSPSSSSGWPAHSTRPRGTGRTRTCCGSTEWSSWRLQAAASPRPRYQAPAEVPGPVCGPASAPPAPRVEALGLGLLSWLWPTLAGLGSAYTAAAGIPVLPYFQASRTSSSSCPFLTGGGGGSPFRLTP